MTTITPFSNDEFQIDMIPDGDSFKVAAPGLAKSLGFRQALDMTRGIPPEEKGYEIVRTPGGDQEIGYVTESGFYRAIGNRQAARVKDPEIRAQVERFQSWVYGEVLPSIRRHGAYMTENTIEKILTDPDTLIKLATDLKQERSRRVELEAETMAQAAQLEAATPKVEYHDTFVAESDQLSFRTVASTLDMKEKELRDLLIERRWIYREATTRRSQKTGELVSQYRYSEYADKKAYFIRRQNHDAPRFRGEVDHTLKITPAGAAAIRRAVGKWSGPAQDELVFGDPDAA